MSAPGLTEKLDKIRSPNLQSQQQTSVILQAVEATLKEQKSEPTPTAYFAALLALLDKTSSSGQSKKDLTIAIVYLLDVVTPFAPQPLLRARFTQILQLLAPVISQPEADAPLLRPSIGCLESLLLAQNSASWGLSVTQMGPRSAVSGLLNLSLDPRPKVRKRAQEALKKVLKNPPPTPSLDHPAADMCAEAAMASLTELAENATQSRKEKRSTDPVHDPNMMHALQLIKAVAAGSGGWPSKKIESLCELLISIARTGNEHMTMAIFEIFEMIFEGMVADEVASAKLPRLLEIISDLRPASNDTQLLPAWIAILSRGYDVSAQVEPEDTFMKLPELFEMVSQFLESPSENIRVSSSECLVSFLANCIPNQVILEPSIYDEKTLEKIVKVVEGLFSVKYQGAWMETFTVVGAMFDCLRWRAHPYLLNVTKTIGDMRGSDAFASKDKADEVLGKAVRAMGPEAVLGVLPLNVVLPTKDKPGRAWMVTLLRDYTANTNLAHFRSELVPLSELFFQRVLDHSGPKTMQVKVWEVLVHQVWSILPGYCDLPLDLRDAFDQSFAEMLANLLYQQVELRLSICKALQALVESNRAIASIEEEDDLILQSRVTKAEAQKNLEYLGGFAGNFLAVLFNVYGQTLPHSRGSILQTINAYLSITPSGELKDTFDRVCKMLASALEEAPADSNKDAKKSGSDKMPSTTHTLMDLVITMSIYLPRESFAALFEIATLVIFKGDDAQLQKKAYKMIPRLAESETGKVALQERQSALQALILSSADKCSAPARRERMAAIAAMVPFIPDDSLHFIPSILSEVVIGCKEQNERARSTAFELLVLLGQKMVSANGATIDNSKVPRMPKDAPSVAANIEEFFTMVSAGLAGGTPHMISATITAISRILYEFRESLSTETLSELVQTMDLFLTSNNREIVKSVLGFVKVVIISLPRELVEPRLESMIPNLMVWSHEHKGHFRAKVKHIIERLVRRFGVEIVNKHCPEEDRKLVNNIRKSKERSKRKKDAAKEAGEESDDEESRKGKRAFDNEFDKALYSSSEDEGSASEEDDDPTPRGKKTKKGRAYIVEDEDEPLDLLDRRALANISSTKPVKLRAQQKTKAKVDLDGKLILGEEKAAGGADEMDVDGGSAAAAGESGVNAYVAALKGKDVPKKGLRGKLKWSNKRGKGDDDDDDDGEMDVDEESTAAIKAKVGKGAQKPRGGAHGGGGKRSGKGIAAGRRGLGEDKRRGPAMQGRVMKKGGRR
ncbi:NUC173-domain-containing protein [Cryphonectria parasitica EP155]|uniref:NUC173-domain-containing protein n=1 Tax=Cryphonectria parasitica (strain ATCC 38755 / EP155) TaxID=660469 RepID=A0A9P4Y2Z7_CRYP1|nr:NUC173-domain-containing protein [Cryphonectria parasitica EP155]KAF3766014.1 NUC173-domain-containing protein [Cryphonectria parasitica EP155]